MSPTSATRHRILHIIQNLNYGGMERLLGDLVRFTDAARFESHIVVLQYLGRFATGLDRYATLHQADPLPPWSLLWPRPLIRQLRRIAPDVVHTHSGVWYKASLAARRAGVRRVIHTEHGVPPSDTQFTRWMLRRAAHRTDDVIAVSAPLAAVLAPLLGRDDIRVITNGVDTTRFRPQADSGGLRRELNVSPEVPIIGSIGRLEPVKGYAVAIEAFARLRANWSEGPPPILVLAGDGAERPTLERAVAQLDLQDAVRLMGWRDDVQGLLSAMTIFTLSSWSEGTSVSLLEAMSAGLCPTVTDVGGNAAVVGPALRHRLVPPGDPAALAAAWQNALRDRERRAADARTARGRVEAHFSVAAMVREYERLYEAGSDPPIAPVT